MLQVMWLLLTNQSALFQQISLWHGLRVWLKEWKVIQNFHWWKLFYFCLYLGRGSHPDGYLVPPYTAWRPPCSKYYCCYCCCCCCCWGNCCGCCSCCGKAITWWHYAEGDNSRERETVKQFNYVQPHLAEFDTVENFDCGLSMLKHGSLKESTS